MPTNCEFQLNNINAVYFCGETIEGAITLHTTSPKDIRDVHIIFKGEGKVSWEETETRRDADGKSESYTEYYRGNELYVDNTTFVCGGGTLPVGTHTYTFLIHLPPSCPTSCEGRYGHVRYELSLVINRPFRFDNVFVKPITVIRTIDLNMNPSLRFPICYDEIGSSCFLSCSSGKILANVKVPVSGYSPGQTVNLILHLQNQTMSDVNSYNIQLRKRMSFTAHTPRHKIRQDKNILFQQTFNKQCKRLTNQIFEENFIIPSTPPSTDMATIITVEYYIRVYIDISGCCMNMKLHIPIVIGTIPLRGTFAINYNPVPIIQPSAPYGPMALAPSENSYLIQPTAPEFPLDSDKTTDFPPSYNDLGPPPTFEEAERSHSPFIDTDKDERHRNTGFKPLYPMYSQSEK